MKQAFWMINLSLLSLLIVSEVAFVVMQKSIPRKVSLTPEEEVPLEQKKVTFDTNVSDIYGPRDIFGTYTSDSPLAKNTQAFKVPDFPNLPKPIPLTVVPDPIPELVAPLGVILKGIIYVEDQADQSVAIIQFKSSKQEERYMIGEMILDAQILTILPNKVIVIRSNGQQETLYLRASDMTKDMVREQDVDFKKAIMFQHTHYIVAVPQFLKHISSLGQCISMLDIRTVFQSGVSVGCRIGRGAHPILLEALGLKVDDLLQKIDNIDMLNVQNRLQAYEHIKEKEIGDSIMVTFERNNLVMHQTYILATELDISGPQQKGARIVDQQNTIKKKKILEQKLKLAPTVRQIKEQEIEKIQAARKKNIVTAQSFHR